MTHETPSPESLLEHREWLRAIARSLVRDENDVDDAEQRTWLTVLRNRRPVTSARGWLRHVVRSAAIDEHRSESRRHVREAGSARPEALPPTDHLVMQIEAQRAVASAVAGLPEPYRTTVLLRYIEELSVKDVAARMAVPVKTVETRITRALALLREALDREFGDRRAWCALLLPLWKAKAPISVGAATTGAVLMATKTKVIAAAVAVALLVSGVVWTAVRDSDGPDAASQGSETAAAVPANAAKPRAADSAPKFAITGRVRSRRDGRLVAGAHVAIEHGARGAATASADTADDGTFRIEGAAAGDLRVTAPRFHAATIVVAAPDAGGELADAGDVWLDGAAALLVEVTGPDDAKTAGADVTLVRRKHWGEVATTHSYLRAVADPDFERTVLGSSRTGTDGVAHFDDIVPGNHEVAVRAAGFAAANRSYVDVPAGRDETRTTVRLERAHRLSGRVLTAAGVPAPDRLVDAGVSDWDERGFARTGADGRFVLEDVRAGDVSLRVGRTRGDNPVVAVVRVPDVTDVELRLPAMGAVAGRVTTTDGRPVADAEVGVETDCGWNRHADAIVRTDADGRWRIDEIPAGTLGRFEVRHAGLYHVGPRLEGGKLDERRGGQVTAIDPRVSAGGELRLDATMAKGARLHGRVAGPDGGVAGAWVYFHLKLTKAGQEWETAVADSEGRYSFDFLPPGPAAAVPLHPSFVHPDTPQRLGDALAAGTLPASLTFDLPEGGDVERNFTMVAGTRVAGRVVGPSGEPVAGATVRVEPTSYSSPPTPVAVTDASGAFVMESVAGIGKSKVVAEMPGFAQVNVPEVELKPASRVDGIDVRMAPSPRVAGHVTDADGAAVAGARVTITRPGVRPVVASTDATGAYAATVPWLDGKLVVTAARDGVEAGRAELELSASGAAADVRLAAVSDVTGRVTAAGGGPIAGAVVLTRDASKGMTWYYGDLLPGYGEQQVVRAVTDADGRFRVALPTGAWALLARSAGFVDDFAVVEVPSAESIAIVQRPAVTLSGVLRGDDGKPLAGAVVVLDPSAEVQSPRISSRSYDPQRLQSADYLLLHHTDATGAFSFAGIPEGPYTLIAVLPTATPNQPREVRFGPLLPSGGPHELTLAAPVSTALSGRVVDEGGTAFRDAQMLITVLEEKAAAKPGDPHTWPRQSQVTPAADGSFQLDGLTASSYTLQVRVAYDPTQVQIDGRPTTQYRKHVQRAFHGLRPPRTDLVLTMTELPRIRGRLVDDAGAPLVGWLIDTAPVSDLTLLTSMSSTRADGTFEIADVEDGDYRLVLRCAGQPHRRVALPRPARGGAELGDVVGTLEARIRGRVVDAKGAAVAGASVLAYPAAGGEQFTFKTGDDGAFDATGLDPATAYVVGVAGPDGALRNSGDSVRSDGVRPGTNDVRLVRE